MRESSVELPHAVVFESALCDKLGEARARETIQKTQHRYQALFAERKQYSERALRKHLEENILPGVALYQTLLGDEDMRERAEELVEAVFRAWGTSSRQSIEPMGRLPFFYGLLRVMVKPMMRLNFPEPGWEMEWVEVSGQEISFNMKSCFYLDVLEGYGLPELTAQYCWLDDLIYEDVSPYVRWARKRTLGRGDACCDFRFERVEREE